jgi:hypothetical protein
LQKHGSEQPTLLHWSCLLTELHWLNKLEKLHYCINNNPLDLSFWLSFFSGEMHVSQGGWLHISLSSGMILKHLHVQHQQQQQLIN